MTNADRPDDVTANNERSLRSLARAIARTQGRFSLFLVRCNYPSLREEMLRQLQEDYQVEMHVLMVPAATRSLYGLIKAELEDLTSNSLSDEEREKADLTPYPLPYEGRGNVDLASLPDEGSGNENLTPDSLTDEQEGNSKPLSCEERGLERGFSALMVVGLELVTAIDDLLTSTNRIRDEFKHSFPFPLVIWIDNEIRSKLVRLAADFNTWGGVPIHFELETEQLLELLQQEIDRVFRGELPQISWEPEAIDRDLQARGIELEADLQAGLAFLLGLGLETGRDRSFEAALNCYRQSLGYWQQHDRPQQRGIVLKQMASVYQRQGNQEAARECWQEAIANFAAANRPDLQAQSLGELGRLLRQLEDWQALKTLADNALTLHQQLGDPKLLAQNYGFLAAVALQKQRWQEAEEFAQQAIELVRREGEEREEGEEEGEGEATYYYFLLAKAQRQLGKKTEAIQSLKKARKLAEAQDDPQLYIQILEALRELYFDRGKYLAAFRLKLRQRSLEQQYRLRAFIGAGYLQPQRQIRAVGEEESPEAVAQEIANSDRQQDLSRMLNQMSLEGCKLIVLHGQSGVGKSSLIQAGLVPALKQQQIEFYTVVPIYLRVYQNWRQELRKALAIEEPVSPTLRSSERFHPPAARPQPENQENQLLPPVPRIESERFHPPAARPQLENQENQFLPPSPARRGAGGEVKAAAIEISDLIDRLQQHQRQYHLTVILFDQFEEFFFVTRQEERRKFWEFLRVCLEAKAVQTVKIVLSLREDYLHYLLELERLSRASLGIQETQADALKDILSHQNRYYLGNFSPSDAETVIHSLTDLSAFRLEPDLIQQLVADLAQDLGEVRPIELQVVGAQLQTEQITTLAKYRQLGDNPKERLVQSFLEEVVRDCGISNERAARLVLYLLTDENNTRPLKTKAELLADLAVEADKLNLVLQILVDSGLVFLIPELPADRYQLVHDYLVAFIRQQGEKKLLLEIEQEREQRRQLEAQYRVTEQELDRARQNLGEIAQQQEQAKQELDRTKRQTRRQIRMGVGVAIGAILLAGGIAVVTANQAKRDAQTRIEVANKTANQKIEDANRTAKTQIDRANQTTNIANIKLNKATGELERAGKERDLAKAETIKQSQIAENLQREATQIQQQVAQANQQAAQTQQNLAAVQANLQQLQDKARSADTKLKQAQTQLVAAQKEQQQAQIATRQAQTDKTKAQNQLDRANQDLAQAQEATRTAERAKKQAEAAVAQAKQQKQQLAQQAEKLQQEQQIAQLDLEATDAEVQATESKALFGKGKVFEALLFAMKAGKQMRPLLKQSFPKKDRAERQTKDALAQALSNVRERNTLQGHEGYVLSVSFSPTDGKILASGSSDKTIKLWNLETGENILTRGGHERQVNSVSFHPTNSKILASGSSDNTIKLWNLETGKEIRTLKGHTNYVNSVSFHPTNSKILASGSSDNTIKLWNPETGKVRTLGGHNSQVNSDNLNNPNVQTQEKRSEVNSISFSPDGKTLASGGSDNTIKLWNVETGENILTLKGHEQEVNSVSFSPNGEILASGSWDNTIKLWSLETGENILTLKEHEREVNSVSFSPNGEILASGSNDKIIKLWNSETSKETRVLRGYNRLVRTVSSTTLQGHEGEVNSVSFSLDGKTLASGSNDKTIKLWNIEKSQLNGDGTVTDLDDLMAKGCDWLTDYLKTRPNKRESLGCGG
jgi:WD40 repeat protein/tetratricopeptide (TPR) repeat protein